MGNSAQKSFVPHPIYEKVIPGYSAHYYPYDHQRWKAHKGAEGVIEVVDPDQKFFIFLVEKFEDLRSVITVHSPQEFVCVNLRSSEGFILVSKSTLFRLTRLK